MGFFVGSRNGEMVVEHSGAQEKTNTLLTFLPGRGVCIALMTNSVYSNLPRLAQALEDAVRPAARPDAGGGDRPPP